MRLVAHYVQTTRNAWSVFGRPPVGDIDPLTSIEPLEAELFADHREAVGWYVHERAVLVAVLHLALERGWDRAAANIAIDWRPMNQEVDTDAETYPHARTALEAAIRVDDDVLIAELHRDVGPKAVRLGFTAEGQAHLETAQALYEGLDDPVGQANVLRNMSVVIDMPMHERVRLVRTALDLVPGDVAPNVRAVLMSDLALKLTVESGSEVVDPADYLEGESLTRGALDLARRHGWTDRILEELFHLTRVLVARSRPREALAIVADALPLEIDTPQIRVLLLIDIAKAAIAVGDMDVAVQSYQEARGLVERVGASKLQVRDARRLLLSEQLVEMNSKFKSYDVVEQLARLEARLHSWTAEQPGSGDIDAAPSGPLA
jgi:hypothetical protein